jgi:hypothetical protein
MISKKCIGERWDGPRATSRGGRYLGQLTLWQMQKCGGAARGVGFAHKHVYGVATYFFDAE